MRQLLISSLVIAVRVCFMFSVIQAAEAVQPTTAVQTTAKEASPLEVIKSATEKSTVTFQKKFFYDSKGKADPMYMPWKYIDESGVGPAGTVTGKGTEAELSSLPESIDKQLAGVVWCAKEPLALIGDKIVREGDEIAHVKVLKINKGEVIFLYAGKKFPVKVSS
ncbi:MAG: hypothetical protein QME64_07155 [bacterium]|nr:hypothetical protein [bacterium]